MIVKLNRHSINSISVPILDILDHFYPLRSVSISNREPYFVTPVIKSLLMKRNRLMRRGAVAAADSITQRL